MKLKIVDSIEKYLSVSKYINWDNENICISTVCRITCFSTKGFPDYLESNGYGKTIVREVWGCKNERRDGTEQEVML